MTWLKQLWCGLRGRHEWYGAWVWATLWRGWRWEMRCWRCGKRYPIANK